MALNLSKIDLSVIPDAPTPRLDFSGIDLDSIPDAFDPLGEGYDIETARKHGIKPDKTGHMPSRAPIEVDPIDLGLPSNATDIGIILKGLSHETFDKTIAGEIRKLLLFP